MEYGTLEELNTSYRQDDRRRRVPEGLSKGMRELYDKDLARLEGRDGFEISVTVPDWLPVAKWVEYHERIDAAIAATVGPIVREANAIYRPGQGASKGLAPQVRPLVIEATKEPYGALVLDCFEGVEVWTSLDLDGELLGSHFEPSDN